MGISLTIEARQALTIDDRLRECSGYTTGFNYLRYALATTVLLWHGYGLSYGMLQTSVIWDSPLGLLLKLVLPMFFALSGFLVAASLMRSDTMLKFTALRAVRILPALATEVFVSALILGPMLTTLPLQDYFTDSRFFLYFTNLSGKMHYFLPGVFDNNPAPYCVNGSLWTIPFELACYILLLGFAFTGLLKNHRRVLTGLLISTVLIFVWNTYHLVPGIDGTHANGKALVLCFLGGVTVYMAREYLPLSPLWFAVAVIISLIGVAWSEMIYTVPVFVAYATVYIGLMRPKKIPYLMDGDYSYGLYLYAWPVQQTIVHVLGYRNSWAVNVCLALPITLIIAVLSWHFVEKPALALKKRIVKKNFANQAS